MSTYVNYTQIASDGVLAGLAGQTATYYLRLQTSGIEASQPILLNGDPLVTLTQLTNASSPGAGLNASGYYTPDLSANYIAGATTLFNADVLLDTQVGLNTAAINTLSGALAAEILRAVGVENSLSGALANVSGYAAAAIATTNIGAGLNTSGAYIPDASGIYIASATSLANADLLLNNELVLQAQQILTLSGGLAGEVIRAQAAEANLSGVLSQACVGAGLNISGAYVADASGLYIASATSLANADMLLNNELVVQAQQILTLSGGLAAEIIRAQAAEANLSGVLSQACVGAGLNISGAYVPDVSGQYIAAATSLASADLLLNNQLVVVQQNLVTLSGALATTNIGAGLTASGTYVANPSGIFIAGATSLVSADNALDAQLGVISTIVNNATPFSIADTIVKRDASANVFLASVSVSGTLLVQGPTILGPTVMEGNSTVNGDLNVLGTLTSITQETGFVEDVMIRIAAGNASDALYTGIYTQYGNASGLFASGLVRNPGVESWSLYKNAPIDASNNPVDFTILADLQVNSVTSFSDARLKKDVARIDHAMEKVRAVKGVYFYWNKEAQSTERQVGVIAQDMQAVLPEVVNAAPDNLLSVDYTKIVPLLIEAIKELDERVAILEAKKTRARKIKE